MADDFSTLPHVADGLTRNERIVLMCIANAQRDTGKQNVPTAMLYGRVLEYIDLSINDLQDILRKLSGDV